MDTRLISHKQSDRVKRTSAKRAKEYLKLLWVVWLSTLARGKLKGIDRNDTTRSGVCG
jgi:hypothetical protein